MDVLGRAIYRRVVESGKDLTPIVVVVVGFQILVLQQPFPDLLEILSGTFMVLLGLMLFIEGLEMGLFPIGETMAYSFARKGSLFWLLVFAFGLGFSTTVAEPALIAVAKEAAFVAVQAGLLESDEAVKNAYALGLRLSVAVSVGLAITLGVFRIIKRWPIHYFIIGGYVMVVLMTLAAPAEIIGIAFDSGGVTTSTVTVPLVTALGVGLASSLKNGNPMIDGFGLIAFASLFPMVFVMAYGIMIFGIG